MQHDIPGASTWKCPKIVYVGLSMPYVSQPYLIQNLGSRRQLSQGTKLGLHMLCSAQAHRTSRAAKPVWYQLHETPQGWSVQCQPGPTSSKMQMP